MRSAAHDHLDRHKRRLPSLARAGTVGRRPRTVCVVVGFTTSTTVQPAEKLLEKLTQQSRYRHMFGETDE